MARQWVGADVDEHAARHAGVQHVAVHLDASGAAGGRRAAIEIDRPGRPGAVGGRVVAPGPRGSAGEVGGGADGGTGGAVAAAAVLASVQAVLGLRAPACTKPRPQVKA